VWCNERDFSVAAVCYLVSLDFKAKSFDVPEAVSLRFIASGSFSSFLVV
jgi:hypothetical protein